MTENLPSESDPNCSQQLLAGVLHRVRRNLFYLVSGKALSAVLGLGYLALVVRILGVAGFGQFALLFSFCQAIGTFTKFQSWQPILHYGTKAFAEGRSDDLVRLVLCTVLLDGTSALVGTVLACTSVWFVGPWVGLERAVLPEASLFGLSVAFLTASTSNGLLRMFDRFDLLLVEDNVQAAIRFVGCVVLYLAGAGFAALLGVWFISVVASAGVCAALAWREFRRRVPSVRMRDIWGPAVATRGRSLTAGFPALGRFVWSTNANSSLGLATGHLATLIIGGLLGATNAGLFRIGRQIAEAVAKPIKMIVPVVYPELARLVADGQLELMRKMNRKVTVISAGGAAVALIVLAVVGYPLLIFVGGKPALGAYGVMLLLSAASLVKIATFTLEPTLISLGRPHTALHIQLLSIALYLPALIGLTRSWGVTGAGVAAILAAVLTAWRQSSVVNASYGAPGALAGYQA